jgi:hypothetical protein
MPAPKIRAALDDRDELCSAKARRHFLPASLVERGNASCLVIEMTSRHVRESARVRESTRPHPALDSGLDDLQGLARYNTMHDK